MPDPNIERPLHAFAGVRDRTIKGVMAMFLRQIAIMPVSLLATIFLTRLLQPEDFGIYSVAGFWIYLIISFRDQGFGAALIQQQREPSKEEWNTLFSFQTVFVLVAGLGLYLVAQPLAHFYQMDPRMVWVIRGLSLVLITGLLGSVPNILLERQLAYDVIAQIEVVVTITFHTLAVTLAWVGYGVWSFIAGAMVSELLRAILLFAASSWRIGFSWQGSFLRSGLKFGGLYQLGGLTSLVRDNIAPLLAGPLFGPVAVGYLKWAERTAFLTSQVFVQIATRVSFPSFSRLQEQPETVGPAVQKMLRYLMLTTLPSLAVVAALITWIISLVFSKRWEPATTAFLLLTLRMVGGNITTPCIGVLNALGRVTTSVRILSLWTLVDWMLALILTPLLGFNGVAAAYALGVGLPLVWLLREFRQVAAIDLQYAVVRPLAAGAIAGILTWMLGQVFIADLLSLAAVALVGFLLFPLSLLAMERGRFIGEIQYELQRAKWIIFRKPEASG